LKNARQKEKEIKMKFERNIIEINEDLCTGCGQCVTGCAEGALEIIDGKAKLVSEVYCDGLGACIGECPTGALKIVQREAEDFDEEAVVERLKNLPEEEKEQPKTMACGCPSSNIQTFAASSCSCEKANEPGTQHAIGSELTHWPVQIRLIPPTAPFLKNADLLVAADCAGFAYPNLHRDLLRGKVLLIGCPKFDDSRAYIEKFGEIFSTASIKSVTVVVMEVPCCSGLPEIIKMGMKMAGKQIPLEKVVISGRGEILRREELAA
jgi:NAD-dependent dihydropyrimidine dehydrogenase PreA subunit